VNETSAQQRAVRTSKKAEVARPNSDVLLTLDILSGPQQGADIDALPERFTIGVNREDADYVLFSAEDVNALIEFSGRVSQRLDVRVIEGDLYIGEERISSGHVKSASLPFDARVADVDFSMRERKLVRVIPISDRIVEQPPTQVFPSSASSIGSKIKIVVACLFGAVAANHQFGLAFSSHPTSFHEAVGAVAPSSRHPDVTLEFIQRAQYLGLPELVLKPQPDHVRAVVGSGYVRNNEELESIRKLAAEQGVSLVSHVVNIQTLQSQVIDALAETRLSATVAYLGGGRFQIASHRAEVSSVQDAMKVLLRRNAAIIAISILITDSHRSNEREVGIEITASDDIGTRPIQTSEVIASVQSSSERPVDVLSPESNSKSHRNQFSSVLISNGHRVYGRSVSAVAAGNDRVIQKR
jgi:hypothetical protein